MYNDVLNKLESTLHFVPKHDSTKKFSFSGRISLNFLQIVLIFLYVNIHAPSLLLPHPCKVDLNELSTWGSSHTDLSLWSITTPGDHNLNKHELIYFDTSFSIYFCQMDLENMRFKLFLSICYFYLLFIIPTCPREQWF